MGDLLAQVPLFLTATQWLLIAFELAAPLLLVEGRIRRWMLAGYAAFHVITFASITIIFLPHVVCLSSFVPLESLVQERRALLPSMRSSRRAMAERYRSTTRR